MNLIWNWIFKCLFRNIDTYKSSENNQNFNTYIFIICILLYSKLRWRIDCKCFCRHLIVLILICWVNIWFWFFVQNMTTDVGLNELSLHVCDLANEASEVEALEALNLSVRSDNYPIPLINSQLENIFTHTNFRIFKFLLCTCEVLLQSLYQF